MIGQSISHYRILEKLGEGGMGVVYKAHDTLLDRDVALKFLPAHVSIDDNVKARFLQEAKAAAALNHAHICTVHGIEESDGQMFIVMEYVAGGTIRGKVPFEKVEDAVALAIQIGEALSEAHAKEIVHRDIKADNIMLTSKGFAKIMDFGLAKLKGSLKLTKTSSTVGTLAYMAPEQIQGGEVDLRSDIFSFGVLLFEMLTGKLPFRGEHQASMMYSILNEDPIPVEQFRPDISSLLSNVILRCLEKNPAERFQSINDVVIELRRAQKQSTRVYRTGAISTASAAAQPMSLPDRPTEPLQRQPAAGKRRWLFVAAAAAALVIIAVGVYFMRNTPESKPQFQQMKITRMTTNGKVYATAVSPDGKYLLYVQSEKGKQSLFMRQTATASNVQIVLPSKTQYFGMMFSGDGNFVYICKSDKEGEQGNLYSMPALGGAMTKLIDHVDRFTLSPDGKSIAYVRYTIGDATFELLVANADGTGEHSIAQEKAPRSIGAVSWSPGLGGEGSLIAAEVDDINFASIVLFPPAGGQPKTLSKHEWSSINSMQWLPDGKGIIFVLSQVATFSGSQIWEAEYPAGTLRRITNDLNNYSSVSLTGDSKSMVTTATEYRSSVWRVPSRGAGKPGWDIEKAIQITTGNDDGINGLAETPDGHIAYASSVNGVSQIWCADQDGSNARQITTGDKPSSYPVASPDGKYFAFLRATNGSFGLWKMNVDGSSQMPLTSEGSTFSPSFTPDSKWILYSSVRDGQYRIWKVPIEGGTPQVLTNSHSHTVAVSMDGKFFSCEFQKDERGTTHQVAIFSIGGGEPIKILNESEFGRLLWLPDGKALGVPREREGVTNLFSLSLEGSKEIQLTNFAKDLIFDYSWTRDARSLVLARGTILSDAIMISDFR